MERKKFAVVFGSESHEIQWDHDLVDFVETFLKGLSDDEFRTTVAALNESLSSFEDEDVLEGILATATKTMRMAADDVCDEIAKTFKESPFLQSRIFPICYERLLDLDMSEGCFEKMIILREGTCFENRIRVSGSPAAVRDFYKATREDNHFWPYKAWDLKGLPVPGVDSSAYNFERDKQSRCYYGCDSYTHGEADHIADGVAEFVIFTSAQPRGLAQHLASIFTNVNIEWCVCKRMLGRIRYHEVAFDVFRKSGLEGREKETLLGHLDLFADTSFWDALGKTSAGSLFASATDQTEYTKLYPFLPAGLHVAPWYQEMMNPTCIELLNKIFTVIKVGEDVLFDSGVITTDNRQGCYVRIPADCASEDTKLLSDWERMESLHGRSEDGTHNYVPEVGFDVEGRAWLVRNAPGKASEFLRSFGDDLARMISYKSLDDAIVCNPVEYKEIQKASEASLRRAMKIAKEEEAREAAENDSEGETALSEAGSDEKPVETTGKAPLSVVVAEANQKALQQMSLF